MTQPVRVHVKRPEGEALAHYQNALDLERRAAESVMDWNLDEARRLSEQAKEAWQRYEESAAVAYVVTR